MSFQIASAVERVRDQVFRAQVPDGWQQGRGAFGGLVLGLLTRAMVAVEAEPARRLRTLIGDICGPVMPGEAEISVEVLRRGAHLSNLDARLTQAGAVLARASATLGSARNVQSAPRSPAPPLPMEWAALPPLPIAPPLGPVFAQHYEYRSPGPFPFSGSTEARIEAFIREKQAAGPLDAAGVIALLDSVWPTLYSVETQPRAMATISFTAELYCDPASLSGAEPLRYRAQLAALHDGFMTEFRELWRGDQLLALNQQTMALLR